MTQEILIPAIIVGIFAFIIGIIIGANFFGKNESASNIQKEFDEYKKKVSTHFGKTADLVDNLTDSYKNMFDHLGGSAKDLLTDDEFNRHLTSRAKKTVTLTYKQNKTNERVIKTKTDTTKTDTTKTDTTKIDTTKTDTTKTDTTKADTTKADTTKADTTKTSS